MLILFNNRTLFVYFDRMLCFKKTNDSTKTMKGRRTKRETVQGRKFMSCSHCQELRQHPSWLLIGCTRVNNQSEASSAS